jgi:hypothetical protein
MARPALALAILATTLAAAPAVADGRPSRPDLLQLPATVTTLPLAVTWTPSNFTPGSLTRHYQIRLQDRTDDSTQLIEVPAPGASGPVTASLTLLDGHAYRLRVQGVETVCEADDDRECEVEASGFGDEQRTHVALVARPAPPPPQPQPGPPAQAAPSPQPPAPAPPAQELPAAPPVTAPAPAAAALAGLRLPVPSTASPRRPPDRPRWVAPALSRILDPTRPIRLRWRENRRATFYNVQVFAGRRKILSVFPTAASLIIRPSVLVRGTLQIVVWSASGPKVAPIFERTPWVVQALRTARPATPRV